jgi:hypothetical protein
MTLRNCDLVMKGGVTSGIVYPPAIFEISRKFQLRGIGGTSAGAIAAALAAAAEYRRQCNSGADADKGFELLNELPAFLGSDERLFHLFAPDKATASLFSFVVAMFNPKNNPGDKVVKLFTSYPLSAAIGLIPGLFYILCAALVPETPFRAWSLFVAIVVALLGAAIGAIIGAVLDFFVRIPKNGFGLVSGVVEKNELALSTWLSAKIEEIAGLPPGTPLTFGMLWRAGVQGDPAEDPPDRRERVIDLRMITTSLTEARPYEFPLRTNSYHFNEVELQNYFPDYIVKAMKTSTREGATTFEGLIPMPPISELPIIVATRMSLSFPILLSAVPLYRVDYTPDGKPDPAQVWFSDGGLTSNFPISLFDAPLPGWPTLAINLGSRPANSAIEPGYIPQRHSAGRLSPFQKIDSLVSFGASMVNAMQNWNDTLQTTLPGFRDRIYTIELTSDQGGLNLNMPPQTIADLIKLGEDAGKALVERFDNVSQLTPDASMHSWEDHRWTRLRTTLTMLQTYLDDLEYVSVHPQSGDVSFYDLIAADDPTTIPRRSSYKLAGGAEGRTVVDNLLHQLATLGQQLQAASEIEDHSPRPHPLLQTRADLTK